MLNKLALWITESIHSVGEGNTDNKGEDQVMITSRFKFNKEICRTAVVGSGSHAFQNGKRHNASTGKRYAFVKHPSMSPIELEIRLEFGLRARKSVIFTRVDEGTELSKNKSRIPGFIGR